MIPPCLTRGIIRYISRVNWSNLGEGVVPSPTPRCSSYWKGSLRVALDNGRQLYLLIYIYIYIWVSKVGDRCRGRPEGSHIYIYDYNKWKMGNLNIYNGFSDNILFSSRKFTISLLKHTYICIFWQQVIIQASLIKDDGTLFFTFNYNFSSLVIFLVLGSRW